MASRGTVFERARIHVSRLVMLGLLVSLFFVGARFGDTLTGNLLFAAGCVLAGMGALGRIWCALYIAGFKNRLVISEGPYSLTRNPLYFFSLLGGTGIMLMTQTFTYPALLIAFMAMYYPRVIRNEEVRLLETYGDVYRQYLESVPRFFPRLTKPAEPKNYTVTPKPFRRNLTDAAWFIWAIPLMFLLVQARDALGYVRFSVW